jgi:hypothetical protein
MYKTSNTQYLNMNKFGLYSEKPTISFETHLENLDQETKTLLIYLRKFVKLCGSNVIEEIRPHRIVYAKSLTFRYFLDIQPRKESLIISIRKSRKEPAIEHIVKNMQEVEKIKLEISQAYTKIN